MKGIAARHFCSSPEGSSQFSTKFLLPLVCAGAVLFSCPQRSAAQLPANQLSDATHPSGAPGLPQPDSIWSVDPLSGALNVTIPFITLPAGGRGPKIPYSLHYNSSSTTGPYFIETLTTQVDYQVFAFLYTYGWLSANSAPLPLQTMSGYIPPAGPWTTSGPYQYATVTNYKEFDVDVPNLGQKVLQGGCSVIGPSIYVDESGSSHDLNTINISLVREANLLITAYPTPCQYTSSSTGVTGDGSNILTSSNVSILPDGTKVLSNGLEDSNGNTATRGSDSLGRAAFSTNIPALISVLVNPGGETSIPAGTYSVTTTGANGQNEPYSVTFSTISFGGYGMPHPASDEIIADGYTVVDNYISGSVTEKWLMNQGVSGTINGVTQVTLPNSTSYTINYDPVYGTISQINFPTGGYVRFVYGIRNDYYRAGAFLDVSGVVVTDAYVSDGSTGEKHYSYSFPSLAVNDAVSGIMPTATSQITYPDGSYTQYVGDEVITSIYFGGMGAPGFHKTSSSSYNNTGALVKSVEYGYVGAEPYEYATTVYDGSTPMQQMVWQVTDAWGNVIAKYESDWYSCSGTPCPAPAFNAATGVPNTPPGGWLRITYTNYAYASAPALNAAHIVDKPSQVVVTDGNGHPYSLAQYFYDETLVSSVAGVINHDETLYSASSTLARGNLTTERHCTVLSIAATVTPATAASACSAWISTKRTYDETGQVTSTTDPKEYTTSYSYADCYLNGSAAGSTNGYPTTVTFPDGTTNTYCYYYPTGQLASQTDQNKQTTAYAYSDNLNRLTLVTLPTTTDGTTGQSGAGTTNYYYSDTPGAFSVTTTQKMNMTGTAMSATKIYDGLGRVVQAQEVSDPNGIDYVNTTYDVMGRVQSATNPFRSTGDPTYGITSYLYDALGRKVSQCQPDNTSTPSVVCVPAKSFEAWTYRGNCVLSQDENMNQWQRCSNGLGQLISVQEPNGTASAPSMLTKYSYDPLNNLLSVTQLGGPTTSGVSRNRIFTYDGLSRLLTSFNPETGRVSYIYDLDGNVTSKTDARGVKTAYTYDRMNRVLSKNYSGDASASPFSCYQYGTTANSVGRLINEWTQSASAACSTTAPTTGFMTMRSILTYDAMGRILNEQQNTLASQASKTPYAPAYSYDLAGNLITSTNGVGPAQTATPFLFTNSFDSAGHLQTVSSSQKTNYVTGAANVFPAMLFTAQTGSTTSCPNSSTSAYSPFGGLLNAAYGISTNAPNGVLTLNRAYDNRLRTSCETDQGTGVTSATPGSVTVTITGSEQSQ